MDATERLLDDLPRIADEMFDELVGIRRKIHAVPELGFQEHATTALIKNALRKLELVELPCPTATGAVFALETGRPGSAVLVRADIDALPVAEETPVEFRSTVDGVMHACGHDGHAAMVLGVARVLAERRDALVGRYVFLFQPAEEGGGGARAMIDGGVLDEIAADRMVTAHLASPMPSGLVAARDGLAMAGADLIRIRLEGVGGHGALAPTYGNVVLAAAKLVQTMPELVTDIGYEGIGCVCSAGAVHAGTAANVVPRSARVEGTLRTFLPEQRELALSRLRDECARISDSSGVTATLEVVSSMPPVINDKATAARVRAAAARCLKSAVLEPPPLTPSDDVSEFMNRIPGCHLFIGAAPSSGLPPMHHAPDFDFDERALAVGVVALCAAAIELARDVAPNAR